MVQTWLFDWTRAIRNMHAQSKTMWLGQVALLQMHFTIVAVSNHHSLQKRLVYGIWGWIRYIFSIFMSVPKHQSEC